MDLEITRNAADFAVDEIQEFWLGEGLTYQQSILLAVYQVTGGNLFGDFTKASPRPEA